MWEDCDECPRKTTHYSREGHKTDGRGRLARAAGSRKGGKAKRTLLGLNEKARGGVKFDGILGDNETGWEAKAESKEA